MKRPARLLCLLLALTLLLTACGGGETSSSASSAAASSSAASSAASSTASAASTNDTGLEPATPFAPDHLRIAVNAESGKLDPQNNAIVPGMMIDKQIMEPLIDKNPETGEFIPVLATEWEWVDDTHLWFKLREGVTFHNGQAFTSADVVKTVERMLVGSASASLYSAFDAENTVANGDYEVTIAFKTPYAPALNFLTNARAYIVPHEYLEENGEEALNQNPIGTGPYKFVEWVLSSHCTMTRYEDYWGEPASIKDVTVRFVVDDTARMVALETGEIDIAIQLQDKDAANILDGNVDPHIKGEMVPGQQLNYFAFNLNFEPFQDLRVRQAIAHAVEWESAAEAAGGIIFLACDSCIGVTADYYTPIGIYEYDPELSKQLLAEAGYADGFSFTYNEQEVAAHVRMAEIVQQYLAEVGITMNIEVVDSATWTEINMNGTAEASTMNMTCTTGDPAHTLNGNVLTSSNTIGKFTDETFNEMFNESVSEMDETKRGEIYADIQQYVFDNVLEIPMFLKMIAYGYWDYVEGLYCDPGQQISVKDITFAA